METPLYSRDHKMHAHNSQYNNSPQPQHAQQQHLPAQWTPVDQEIIEDLLLVEPIHVTPTGIDGQYAHMHMYQQQQLQTLSPTSTVASTSSAAHPHPHYALTRAAPPPPQQQMELMAQGLSPGSMDFNGTDDVRKAKHREVQRRFMLRKKVLYCIMLQSRTFCSARCCCVCACWLTRKCVVCLIIVSFCLQEQIKRTKQLAKELEVKYKVLKLSSEKEKLQAENKDLEAEVNVAEKDTGDKFLSKAQVEVVLEVRNC